MFVSPTLTLLLAVLVQTTSSFSEVTGERIPLTVGQLMIPQEFSAPDGEVHMLVHFHGASKVVEQNVAKVDGNRVIVNVTLNGLSGVYRDKFLKSETFTRLLDESVEQLRQRKIAESPKIARLTVSSFSAGFGAVRELLKSDEHYRRIDALIMADSIYAGFVDDWKKASQGIKRDVEPKHLEGFLRFARDAADGKKTLVISHCQLRPETYASTGETADYLLTKLGLDGERKPVNEDWADGWRCLSRCDRGGLHVLSFAGETGTDHLQHLRNLQHLLRIAEANPKAADQ